MQGWWWGHWGAHQVLGLHQVPIISRAAFQRQRWRDLGHVQSSHGHAVQLQTWETRRTENQTHIPLAWTHGVRGGGLRATFLEQQGGGKAQSLRDARQWDREESGVIAGGWAEKAEGWVHSYGCVLEREHQVPWAPKPELESIVKTAMSPRGPSDPSWGPLASGALTQLGITRTVSTCCSQSPAGLCPQACPVVMGERHQARSSNTAQPGAAAQQVECDSGTQGYQQPQVPGRGPHSVSRGKRDSFLKSTRKAAVRKQRNDR